ncbi:hypothetical protein NDU88_003669 [Pleurodeles waltl]|uniref:Uncharacterized protein n=1 Tax=Pleurodeles waltl TaxID=8319 RepID=A0AAV7WPR1_PLEWA|nr:hypothetical protein NDU88_003669 [Pleurodeles waltl]
MNARRYWRQRCSPGTRWHCGRWDPSCACEGLEAGRCRVTEVGLTQPGPGDRGQGARPGPLEVSHDGTGGRGVVGPGARRRCEGRNRTSTCEGLEAGRQAQPGWASG